jgi:hypothetical protein
MAALLCLAFAPGCMGDGETVDVADEDDESAPDRSQPAVPPDREPERGDCAPLYYEQPDGNVIAIPVECEFIPFDKGDPPNESPVKQHKDPVENPAMQGQQV